MSSRPDILQNNQCLKKAEENMAGFTSRQIEWTKLHRKIYSKVGLPTVKNFKHMVFTKMLSNCTISVANIINNIYIWNVTRNSRRKVNKEQNNSGNK